MIDVKTILSTERERILFADRAAAYFNEHPESHTFTDGDVKPGVLFAIRWAFPKPTQIKFEDGIVELAESYLAGGRTPPIRESTTIRLARAVIDAQPAPAQKVISVLVFELPYDAVLVGDLDTK